MLWSVVLAHPGVERGGDVSGSVPSDSLADLGAARPGERSTVPCRSSRRPARVRKTGPVQRLPAARSIALAALGRAGGDDLAALMGDGPGTVPASKALVLDVRPGGVTVDSIRTLVIEELPGARATVAFCGRGRQEGLAGQAAVRNLAFCLAPWDHCVALACRNDRCGARPGARRPPGRGDNADCRARRHCRPVPDAGGLSR